MLERGDMATLHEPFLYLYYVHDAKRRLPHHDIDPERPTSYEDIRSTILDAARTRPVFVKDMCYYVSDYVHADEDFIRRMTSTFLIAGSFLQAGQRYQAAVSATNAVGRSELVDTESQESPVGMWSWVGHQQQKSYALLSCHEESPLDCCQL